MTSHPTDPANGAMMTNEKLEAAITACALMVKGICLTKPNAEWTALISERIRFMLKTNAALLSASAPAAPLYSKNIEWPEGYCLDPNGAMCCPDGAHKHWSFGYDLGYADALAIRAPAAPAQSSLPAKAGDRFNMSDSALKRFGQSQYRDGYAQGMHDERDKSAVALDGERAALTEVGFIAHDDLYGWHFAPTVAWTWLGKGRALYARAASPQSPKGDRERHALAWLRRNANAEKDPKAKAAFVEAHNAVLAILEGRIDAPLSHPTGKAEDAQAASTDTARLDFMITWDARVARSRDGDVWHVGRFEDAEGELEWCRLGPTCDTAREAIDAAMAAAQPESGVDR